MVLFFSATFACLKEGMVVCSPNPDRHEKLEDPPLQHSYIINLQEILACPLVAKLVVLSAGFGASTKDFPNTGYRLASAFLAAGKTIQNC